MGDGWPVNGKVSTGTVHGPRRSRLSRWSGSSLVRQRRGGSPGEKMEVRRCGEQLRATTELHDLHRGREWQCARAVHGELRWPEQKGTTTLTGADNGTVARTKCEGFEPFYRHASHEGNAKCKGMGRLGRCCTRLAGSVSMVGGCSEGSGTGRCAKGTRERLLSARHVSVMS
jgi:hypothetical protein